MPMPLNGVREDIMFLGCLIVPFVRLFVCPFVWSDIVTIISHEWLEQFW